MLSFYIHISVMFILLVSVYGENCAKMDFETEQCLKSQITELRNDMMTLYKQEIADLRKQHTALQKTVENVLHKQIIRKSAVILTLFKICLW